MSFNKPGFSDWFQEQTSPEKLNQFDIARVVGVHKESYLIHNGEIEIRAELTGKFMFTAESAADYPTVGDWCYVQYFDENSLAIIHELLPRKTLLKRKTSGKKVDFQLIAANIDKAFIIQSLDHNYNLNRIERYLVMINEYPVIPVILLSKRDLLSSDEIPEKVEEINRRFPGVDVLAFSNLDNSEVDTIKNSLAEGETFCLLGSSGVGKTSLLNNLLGNELFETQTVREKDSKGKHTTTHRQLVTLDNGAFIIDVPGIRELGNFDVDIGLQETFSDISEIANRCRFRDCTHTGEEGCAVLAAVNDNLIPEERYQNYLKLVREAEHYGMSYVDKRRKDKNFGKMVKSVMQIKKKNLRG